MKEPRRAKGDQIHPLIGLFLFTFYHYRGIDRQGYQLRDKNVALYSMLLFVNVVMPSTLRGLGIELIFENEIADILGNTENQELKLYTQLYFSNMYVW